MGTISTTTNKPFTLRIPDAVKKDLEFVSTMTKRSQASVALEAISESVALRAKHMKMIEEGKQAADRGELIPHDEVIAWVESLGTNNELPMPQSSVSK